MIYDDEYRMEDLRNEYYEDIDRKQFEEWWRHVDEIVTRKLEPWLGRLGVADLPYLVFVHDLFRANMEPSYVADELIESWCDEGDIPPECRSVVGGF